jgi:hypothetical protein
VTKFTPRVAFLALCSVIAAGGVGSAQVFTFSAGAPDGRMATAARPSSSGVIEIESADDFVLASQTTIDQATFTGLLPSGAPLTNVTQVVVEMYRVFPLDSANPPSGNVPTRNNSPSDVAFDSRDSAVPNLTFVASILNPSFTAANSVVNGIHKIPNQTTGGEGAVTGEEVLFNVTFTTSFSLPAGHYFFIPQVKLSSGNFLWLSSAAPPPFVGDLQSWIRNADLDPDWLRVGTDIVDGGTPPTFNGSFSLSGTVGVAPTSTPTSTPTNTPTASPTSTPTSAPTGTPTGTPRPAVVVPTLDESGMLVFGLLIASAGLLLLVRRR